MITRTSLSVSLLVFCLSFAAESAEGPPVVPPGFNSDTEVLAAIATGRVALANGDLKKPEGLEERIDVEYGRVGERPLLLDLYVPADVDGPTPCVVIIHGGGWQGGNKGQKEYKYYIYPLTRRGYIVASVAYRFSDEAKYPAAVQDAMCAIRFLRANAQSHSIDPDRIAVAGWSAGAHLAMMAGYAGGVEKLNTGGGWEGTACKVRCVVNLYGPTDLTFDFARDHELVQAFMPVTYDEDPDLYAEASPITHVDKDDPPTLTIHGTIDSLVAIQHADALAGRLSELGVPYVYDRVEGWPHVLDLEKRLHERTKFLMFRFLDSHLREAEANDSE